MKSRTRTLRWTRSANQLVDTIGNARRCVAQLRHGPVGGVALGDVIGRGMVDQPLGEDCWQHGLTVGNGSEAVSEGMEPEPRPASPADAGVQMLDGFEVAGRTCLWRKHPTLRHPRGSVPLREPALQDGGKQPRDRELQRLAALGGIGSDGHGRHVDLRPADGNHFRELHAGLAAESEGVARDRVVDRRLKAPVQAR